MAKKLISSKNLIFKERGTGLLESAVNILKKSKKIGFERDDLKYGEYEFLKKNLKNEKLFPVSGLIENFRANKKQEEISKIKKAVKITDQTFKRILKIIKPGLTEKYLAWKIIDIMRDFGGDEVPAFAPIVAAGKNSAEIHHFPSNKKIKKGEMILFDMGAKYKGYCADLSRTIFLGKASQKFKTLYHIILTAQEKAIKEIKTGFLAKDCFEIVLNDFKKRKKENFFLHGLGHGVGVAIHEAPSLSGASKDQLNKGMIFTIEPGLYEKGFGGIRIEDVCLLQDKLKVLSQSPKKLMEI